MIFITAKFKIRPEDADRWPQIAAEFTEATRNEPGCLWFDWSRSVADPDEYVLVEAFRDGEAGGRTSTPRTSRRRSGTCLRIWRAPRGSSTSRSRRTTGPCSARWPSQARASGGRGCREVPGSAGRG